MTVVSQLTCMLRPEAVPCKPAISLSAGAIRVPVPDGKTCHDQETYAGVSDPDVLGRNHHGDSDDTQYQGDGLAVTVISALIDKQRYTHAYSQCDR
jgi:hypothetical protein